MINRKKIKVISFDFDGCLFPFSNTGTLSVIDNNSLLLSAIEDEINTQKYLKTILFVGSNRQSYSADTYAGEYFSQRGVPQYGSCFIAINEIQKNLTEKTKATIIVDKYLMADTFNYNVAGFSFDRAIQSQTNTKLNLKHCYAIHDPKKFIILYAQMHKIALENPHADIIFDFYEDTSGILNFLTSIFKENPDLIPSNIHLNLNRYEGKMPFENVLAIQGTGEVDPFFEKNIRYYAFGNSQPQTDIQGRKVVTVPLDDFKKLAQQKKSVPLKFFDSREKKPVLPPIIITTKKVP